MKEPLFYVATMKAEDDSRENVATTQQATLLGILALREEPLGGQVGNNAR